MPIYEYRCDNDHLFEVMQRMADDPLQACTVCGAPVHRVFHPVAVHFKGSGFYNTDYGKQKKGATSDGSSSSGESKSDGSSGSSSSSDSSKGSSDSSKGSSDQKTAAAGD
jgi:putative FmdB family regulatory protein